MEAPQRRSPVDVDRYEHGFQDRNSDIRVEPSQSQASQSRFSDYEHSADWDAERGSVGLVYEQADVRVSASSDQLITPWPGKCT